MSYSPRQQVSHQYEMDYLKDQYYRGALIFVAIFVIIAILIDLYFVNRSINGGKVSELDPSWTNSAQVLFIVFAIFLIVLGYGTVCGLRSDMASWNDKIAIGVLFLAVLAGVVWYHYLLFMSGDGQAALAIITMTFLLTIFLYWYVSAASMHGSWALIIFLIFLALVSLCNLKWANVLQVQQNE